MLYIIIFTVDLLHIVCHQPPSDLTMILVKTPVLFLAVVTLQ